MTGDYSGNGGMKFKGAGSTHLKGLINYKGITKIENGSSLVIENLKDGPSISSPVGKIEIGKDAKLLLKGDDVHIKNVSTVNGSIWFIGDRGLITGSVETDFEGDSYLLDIGKGLTFHVDKDLKRDSKDNNQQLDSRWNKQKAGQ